MKTIWKFVLAAEELQTIAMPADATLLYAREQGNDICVWAEVETSHWAEFLQEDRTFEVFATGQRWPDNARAKRAYLGSAHLQGGALVFHVYERKP